MRIGYILHQTWSPSTPAQLPEVRPVVVLWLLILALLATLYLLQGYFPGLGAGEMIQPPGFMGPCNGLPGPC